MNLQLIAHVLGGSVCGNWMNIPGPGHSQADRSLGVCFDAKAPDGFWVFSHSGDSESDCRLYVKARLHAIGIDDVTIAPVHPAGQESKTGASQEAAIRLWSESLPAEGTSVEAYLASRGCLGGAFQDWKGVLRFHPECPFGQRRFPAMVALVKNVLSGAPQGIQRTALADDGLGKRIMPDGMNAKMMMGPSKQGAVMLGPLADDMGIAEGIETALSAQSISGLPVWALMSAGGVSGFPLIAGVQELTIFADHDKAGLDAAANCAGRYAKANVKGQIHHPPKPGDDWNDYLQSVETNKNDQ